MIRSINIQKLKEHKFFGEFFTEKAFAQLKKYLITGFLCFGIEYFSFTLLYYTLLIKCFPKAYMWIYHTIGNFVSSNFNISLTEKVFRAILANVIVYIVIFWLNFTLNRYWSFQSKKKLGPQLLQYGILFIFNLFVGNIFLMYIFSGILGFHPLFAKIINMGFIVSWNFIIYKKIIYT